NDAPVSAGAHPLFRGFHHGQSGHHQGQARVLGGHRLLLRRQEEFAHHDRQAGQEEVRSGCAQARRIPRSQNQVTRGTILTSTGPLWPRFYSSRALLVLWPRVTSAPSQPYSQMLVRPLVAGPPDKWADAMEGMKIAFEPFVDEGTRRFIVDGV